MKKKIIFGILIFIVLLLGLAYIGGTRQRNGVEPKFTIKTNYNEDKVTMAIKEGTLTNATIVIHNNSNEELGSRRMV